MPRWGVSVCARCSHGKGKNTCRLAEQSRCHLGVEMPYVVHVQHEAAAAGLHHLADALHVGATALLWGRFRTLSEAAGKERV